MSKDSTCSNARPLCPGPVGRARRGASGFIVVFLLIQVLVPLRYYLAGTDERFCWRMFSSVSRQRCRVSVYETVDVDGEPVERRVPLRSLVQVAWHQFLIRYHQPDLVRKMLRWQCGQRAVRRFRYQRIGYWPDGTPIATFRLMVGCRPYANNEAPQDQ